MTLMRLTPEKALDIINADVAKAFNDPKIVDGVELAISQFVQASLDAFVERGNLDVQVKFSVQIDPKKGQYMAFLSGSF